MCPTSSKKWISEDFVFFDQKKLIKLNWIAIFLKKKNKTRNHLVAVLNIYFYPLTA